MKKYNYLIFLMAFTLLSYGQEKAATNVAESPSLIQLIPILISSLALLFSIVSLFFNYYMQYQKKPEISILISEKLKSWIGDNKLRCNSTVTIFNKGAQYGAVYKITGKLCHTQTNTITTMMWDMFMQDKNIGEIGKTFKTHTAFDSYAETLVIQGRTAITKKIQFRSIEDFELKIGDYNFDLFVFTGTNKIATFKTSKKFSIKQVDIDNWKIVIDNVDNENRVANKSFNFNLLET